MRKQWIMGLLCPLLMVGCAKTIPVQEEELMEPVELSPLANQEEGVFVPGVAYAYVTEDFSQVIEKDLEAGMMQTKSSSLNSLMEELGVVSMSRLFPDAGEFEERTRREGLHRWYKVVYNPSQSLTKASYSLENVPGVEFVEGQRQIQSKAVFNDPMLSNQWHYINTTHKGVDINVEKVWSHYSTGNSKVIVAVMDQGVDLNHEDLAENVLAGGPNGSKNFYTGGYVIDADPHGTHVAGTIAALNNNGKGGCGIAGGDAAKGIAGVKIMSCEMLSEDKDRYPGISADTPGAAKWAADHGAVISQNSWGYVLDTNYDGQIDAEELERAKNLKISSAEKAAYDYFIKYAGCDNDGNQLSTSPMKGGVVIFAAGNDAIPYGPPGSYEAFVAVGAIDSEGKRAEFSNYGDWVDIAAPGVSVRSTAPGNQYANSSGTSMACPHVSGVAALIVSHFGGPGFTADMLKERLLKGANPNILPMGANIGPLVDALGSFLYGSADAPQAVSTYTVTPVSNSVDFTWKVTGNSVGEAASGYVLFASEGSLAGINPASPPENVKTAVITTDELSVGDEVTGRLPKLEFETTYNVALAGYDYGHNFSALSPVKQVKTEKNNPPVITTSYSGDYKVRAHQVIDIPYSVYDPDGHTLTIVFTSGSEADQWTQSGDNSYILTLTGKAATPGSYTASVVAKDEYGVSTSLSIPYTILENQPPQIIKTIDNMVFNNTGEKFTLEMDEFIQDPDGETLRYSINIANKSVLNLNQQENTLYGTTLGYGMTEVTLTGADAKGLTAVLTFKVLVRSADVVIVSYPNPVTSVLSITNPENTPVSMDVKLLSATGGKVYEGTVQASAFEPATIDLSGVAPGVYTLIVTYSGKEYKQTIVKK